MQKIILSPEHILSLRTLHRATKDRRKADRIKTILFLHQGFTITETAELLMLDEETIRIIRDRFDMNDMSSFLTDGYVAYQGKLTKEQEEIIRIFVRNTIIMDSSMVVDHIKTLWNIEYKPSGVVSLLHRLNFIYKKTKHMPAKADPVKQQEHIEKYNTLIKNMKDTEILYFMDGVHPLHNSINACGWIEKGSEKYIKSNTGRDRVNINGAYCLQTQEVVIVTADSINAQSTIELYKKIEAKHPEKTTIFIVRDNAKYYSNKEVQAYLATSKIVEIPLPTYSPNLNPIERLWLFMKEKLLYNKYYEHFSEFKEVIRKFFNEDFELYRPQLSTFITDNFHVL
jgi:transposase